MLLNSGVQPWDMQHIQNPMIKHNTSRQILLGGAIVAYIYMVGDGVLNYNGPVNSVKKATTLSTILPGAGQMYNKSLWKVPIVVGGFATMAYIVDFNTRGYNRFKLAYNLVSAGEQDEFNGRYSAEYLKDLKNNYRRNRDLSIIITAGFYILNIVDAHVDAHLKDYDISDDLGVELYPYIDQLYTSRGMTNTVGMTMSFKF